MSGPHKHISGITLRCAECNVSAYAVVEALNDRLATATAELETAKGRIARFEALLVRSRDSMIAPLLAALDVVEAVRRDHVEGRNTHTARAYFEQQLPALVAFDAALSSSTDAPCLCDDIDLSDRPCLVCEARAVLSSGETGKGA